MLCPAYMIVENSMRVSVCSEWLLNSYKIGAKYISAMSLGGSTAPRSSEKKMQKTYTGMDSL